MRDESLRGATFSWVPRSHLQLWIRIAIFSIGVAADPLYGIDLCALGFVSLIIEVVVHSSLWCPGSIGKCGADVLDAFVECRRAAMMHPT
jgi:hypothetical protein